MVEPRTLYAWFERSATAHGDRTAVEVDGHRLGYGELRDRATRLAARLLAAHGGRPARVGLLAGRSIGAYVGYLGILRAGAAVVPLNPEHPAARIRGIVDGAELDLVVTDAAAADLGVPQVDAATDAAADGPVPPPPTAADDTAYIIFTSGSTGAPKGVPISHRNICSYLERIAPRYDLGPGSRASGNFELTFDGSVHDLFVTWGNAATLVVPSRGQLLSPVMAVNRLELTHWFSVPSLIGFAERLESLKPGAMPTLRWSLFGGAAVPLAAARRWREAAANSRVEVLYGPTEVTIAATSYRLPDDPADWPQTPGGVAPIGELLPGLEAVVVDEDDVAAETGELCVRGSQRFGGYLDPERDKGAFLPDDAARADGSRLADADWYRTGDRVTGSAAGLLYLGRRDEQVKIHGHRIEPGEIEAELLRLPAVREAAVLAVPVDGADPELIAAVCGQDCEPRRLFDALRDRLPPYMLPRRITTLDRLPLNDNGKLDRKALLDRLGAV